MTGSAAAGLMTIRFGRCAIKGLRTSLWILALCLFMAPALPAPQEVTVRSDGTLLLEDSTEIPPYAVEGGWVEGTAKHSDRYRTRHFLFKGIGRAPALELFINSNTAGENPDGVFESAFVNAFIKSFSAGMGLTYDAPVVDYAHLGMAPVERFRVQLRNHDASIWFYAYVFLRHPSLIFLTIRPRSDATTDIEGYLAKLRFKQ